MDVYGFLQKKQKNKQTFCNHRYGDVFSYSKETFIQHLRKRRSLQCQRESWDSFGTDRALIAALTPVRIGTNTFLDVVFR